MYGEMPLHEGRRLPQFTLREIDLHQVAQWEVGGEYYLVVKVEMIGKHNNNAMGSNADQSKIEGDFQMQAVKVLDKNTNVDKVRQRDWEEKTARYLSGEK